MLETAAQFDGGCHILILSADEDFQKAGTSDLFGVSFDDLRCVS